MRKYISLILSLLLIFVCLIPLGVYAQNNIIDGDLSYEEGGKRYVPIRKAMIW